MTLDLDAIIEEAVVHGEIAAGTDPYWLARHHDAGVVAVAAQRRTRTGKAPQWRREEDAYLRQHYLFQSDGDLADHLGRSVDAVHLRITRELCLPSRSHLEDWPTVRGAILRLGLSDRRALHRWAEMGLIEIYKLPLGGNRRVVYWPRIVRFAVNPMHWIYFDTTRVQDEHLRLLIERQRRRWNDEWWTTGQVAAYHGVHHTDVQRLIKRGEIKATAYGNWRVLRSEATRPDIVFYRGKGRGRSIRWSSNGDAFLVLGRALGFSWRSLSRMAHFDYVQRAQHRMVEMQKNDLIQATIDAHGLRVQHDADTGYLLADWRDEPHRRRFCRLAQACERFRDGLPLSSAQINLVAGTLYAWAMFCLPEDRRAFVRGWAYWGDFVGEDRLREARNTLGAWGVDPFGERRAL